MGSFHSFAARRKSTEQRQNNKNNNRASSPKQVVVSKSNEQKANNLIKKLVCLTESDSSYKQNGVVAGSKGREQIANDLNERHEEDVSYVGIDRNARKKKRPMHIFTWTIDGFTSLLEKGEGSTSTCFKMEGFSWTFLVNLMDRKSNNKDSEKHLSLGLRIQSYSTSPNCMIETTLNFFIHDQQYGKHIEREVSHTYLTTSCRCGVSCMIPLQTLKKQSLGFLVNDTIAVGVELIQFEKVPCSGLERNSVLQKNQSTGSYSWYIEDFSTLKRPSASSESFQIAGYTWRLYLDEESFFGKNYLGLYLSLEDKSGSKHTESSGVMVNAVLSLKRKSQRSLQYTVRHNFMIGSPGYGFTTFIKLEDFKNPSNGYLIKGTCTFEASLCILGSANDRAS